MEEKEYRLWFCSLHKIQLSKKKKLMGYFQKAERIFKAGRKELAQLRILTEEETDFLCSMQEEGAVMQAEKRRKEAGAFFCIPGEREYPYLLSEIADPPFGIFYKGRLPSTETVTIAMVGARACSNYGKEMAYFFARELAKSEVQIVSGLARGIDGFSHGGALYAKGKTYAVLGCGIDVVYPPEHDRMYREILEEGGILTEYPFGMPPYRWNFPPRNRVISGLSNGVFVVEARGKSGSLITADFALEQGRDVFALPGRAGDPLSLGTNQLIKQGAVLADKPEDILEFYQISPKKRNGKKDLLLETQEEMVYANLGLEEKHFNRLVQETGMGTGDLMEILLRLSEKGIVGQTGQYFHKILPKEP